MNSRKKKTAKKMNVPYVVGAGVFVVVAVFVGLSTYSNNRTLFTLHVPKKQLQGAELDRLMSKIDTQHPSRTWMNFMMSDVRDNEKNPPEAARAYAYIATVFHEVRSVTSSEEQANRATRAMLIQMYPYLSVDANRLLNAIQGNVDVALTEESLQILQKYVERWKSEPHGHGHVDVPQDSKLWKPISESGVAVEPLAIEATGFKRWGVAQDFHLDPPPAVGSPEDAKEIEIIKEALKSMPEWKERIHKWALAKGTGTPAWLWQEKLYEYGEHLDDITYGRIQKDLAQSVSDAFVICWQKKYTFWTARPFMRIPGLVPAIETPFFPGYPSGHATVSAASATVLGHLFPSRKKELLQLATEAKDSRLYSGIHFSADNEKGFELGVRIGAAEIEALHLQSVE